MHIAANSCFTGSSLVINNSVASHMVGKANGIGMACTAIARSEWFFGVGLVLVCFLL